MKVQKMSKLALSKLVMRLKAIGKFFGANDIDPMLDRVLQSEDSGLLIDLVRVGLVTALGEQVSTFKSMTKAQADAKKKADAKEKAQQIEEQIEVEKTFIAQEKKVIKEIAKSILATKKMPNGSLIGECTAGYLRACADRLEATNIANAKKIALYRGLSAGLPWDAVIQDHVGTDAVEALHSKIFG